LIRFIHTDTDSDTNKTVNSKHNITVIDFSN